MITTQADHIVQDILARHPEQARAQIEAWVAAELDVHRHDRVQNYTPLLVTRAIEERLRQTHSGADAPTAA